VSEKPEPPSDSTNYLNQGAADGCAFLCAMEVVRATDRELTVRRDRFKNAQLVAKAKEERLVRE
jgi:hypothetical protein